jgi:hypothetical protein
MRPDDVRIGVDESTDAYDLPIAADLRPLDAELTESGDRARRMLHGRTQPTNYFAMDLRARLLGSYSGDEPGGSATLDVTAPRSKAQVPRPIPQHREPRRAEASLMAQVLPRIDLGAPAMLVNARWAFLAAAVATGLLIAGALGTGAIPR